MATFAQIKERVAAYMNRSPGSFVVGSVDILDEAVRGARKWAELQHNFELARLVVMFPNFLLNQGALLSEAVNYANPSETIHVKVLERAFLLDPSSGEPIPIGVHSRAAHVLAVRKGTRVLSTVNTQAGPAASLIRFGDHIYLSGSPFPTEQPLTLVCDAVRWMPEYSQNHPSDFFTTYGERFLLYKSIFDLNFYLKEDQRVQLSEVVVQQEWNNLLRWDASLVNQVSEDFNLE